jgi:alanine-glyoxylate transaminase / serine-glyoxylate transaminase / serine-pyruvate transaminase
MSGTGHAGMEASIANLVEPGETVLVGNKGIWGARVADLAGRYGANVVELKTGGEPRAFTLQEITAAVKKHKPALLFLCQGESSMGALTPLHCIAIHCELLIVVGESCKLPLLLFARAVWCQASTNLPVAVSE